MRVLAACVIAFCGWSSLEAAEVTIDCAQKHQIMQGFGTCLKSWGDPAKDPVSHWQFEAKTAELYVNDLGLNIVRIPLDKFVFEGENPYKIASCVTAEIRADATKISWENFAWEHAARRHEARLTPAIVWVQQVLKFNPSVKIIASVWTPPHWMKEECAERKKPGAEFSWSKFGESSCGGRLSPKYYTHFAHYLAQWSIGLEKKFNIPLYAVSIQNELHFYEPYDSCIYTPSEFAAVVKEVGRVFKELGVKTLIMGPEDMTKFPERLMGFVNPVMAEPSAKQALSIVCSHGYSDGIDSDLTAADASKLRSLIRETGKEYWMTETGGGAGTWDSADTKVASGAKKGQKRTIPGAFAGLAAMMHSALADGDASAWCTWQFLDDSAASEHGLVEATMEELKPIKKFYVQKHYSKFILPGSRRVEASEDAKELLASAFYHEDRGNLCIVLQNHANTEQTIDLNVKGGPAISSFEIWCTNREKNCEKLAAIAAKDGKALLTLPPQSIVTLTGIK